MTPKRPPQPLEPTRTRSKSSQRAPKRAKTSHQAPSATSSNSSSSSRDSHDIKRITILSSRGSDKDNDNNEDKVKGKDKDRSKGKCKGKELAEPRPQASSRTATSNEHSPTRYELEDQETFSLMEQMAMKWWENYWAMTGNHRGNGQQVTLLGQVLQYMQDVAIPYDIQIANVDDQDRIIVGGAERFLQPVLKLLVKDERKSFPFPSDSKPLPKAPSATASASTSKTSTVESDYDFTGEFWQLRAKYAGTQTQILTSKGHRKEQHEKISELEDKLEKRDSQISKLQNKLEKHKDRLQLQRIKTRVKSKAFEDASKELRKLRQTLSSYSVSNSNNTISETATEGSDEEHEEVMESGSVKRTQTSMRQASTPGPATVKVTSSPTKRLHSILKTAHRAEVPPNTMARSEPSRTPPKHVRWPAEAELCSTKDPAPCTTAVVNNMPMHSVVQPVVTHQGLKEALESAVPNVTNIQAMLKPLGLDVVRSVPRNPRAEAATARAKAIPNNVGSVLEMRAAVSHLSTLPLTQDVHIRPDNRQERLTARQQAVVVSSASHGPSKAATNDSSCDNKEELRAELPRPPRIHGPRDPQQPREPKETPLKVAVHLREAVSTWVRTTAPQDVCSDERNPKVVQQQYPLEEASAFQAPARTALPKRRYASPLSEIRPAAPTRSPSWRETSHGYHYPEPRHRSDTNRYGDHWSPESTPHDSSSSNYRGDSLHRRRGCNSSGPPQAPPENIAIELLPRPLMTPEQAEKFDPLFDNTFSLSDCSSDDDDRHKNNNSKTKRNNKIETMEQPPQGPPTVNPYQRSKIARRRARYNEAMRCSVGPCASPCIMPSQPLQAT